MFVRNESLKVFPLLVALLSAPGLTMAADIGTPDQAVLNKLYPGKTFSPYAQRSFPSHIYWGETHLHTGLSLDAGPRDTSVGTDPSR